jgi:uncharacterized paraquat-inducible protein A
MYRSKEEDIYIYIYIFQFFNHFESSESFHRPYQIIGKWSMMNVFIGLTSSPYEAIKIEVYSKSLT